MERTTRLNPWPFATLFFVGLLTLTNFSQHVRAVDAVGLSGSGFALGVGVVGFITAMRAGRKT
jgi:hypothetical protein